jgi:hypothetical protein
MAAATSHEVESSVIAVQFTRQYVIDVLRTAGLPEMADEALHELPDPELVSMWAIFQLRTGHRNAIESCLSIHSVTTVVMRVMAPVQGTPVLALEAWLTGSLPARYRAGVTGHDGDLAGGTLTG